MSELSGMWKFKHGQWVNTTPKPDYRTIRRRQYQRMRRRRLVMFRRFRDQEKMLIFCAAMLGLWVLVTIFG